MTTTVSSAGEREKVDWSTWANSMIRQVIQRQVIQYKRAFLQIIREFLCLDRSRFSSVRTNYYSHTILFCNLESQSWCVLRNQWSQSKAFAANINQTNVRVPSLDGICFSYFISFENYSHKKWADWDLLTENNRISYSVPEPAFALIGCNSLQISQTQPWLKQIFSRLDTLWASAL